VGCAIVLLASLLLSHGGNILADQRSLPHNALLQGLYEECRPSDRATCGQRLDDIARGGFDVVLNYSLLFGSAADIQAYADRAQKDGLLLIWSLHYLWRYQGTDLRQAFPPLAATCACSDNTGFIAYIISLARNHPSTWGYYVGDEIESSDHALALSYADLIHRIDPTHPRLFIADAQADNPVWQDKSPFYDAAEVIGDDHYPVGRQGYTVGSAAQVAKGIQAYADRHQRQSAIVLQAFTFSEYSDSSSRAVCSPWPTCAPFPTRSEMQEMLNLTLSNSHPRLVLWYSYFDIMRSDNPTQHWKDLVAVVGRVAT
jgi:hypothetical protein